MKLRNIYEEKLFYRGQYFENLNDLFEQALEEHGMNSFVSFTWLPKIGINPMSEYLTPIGIYMYPLSYVLEEKFDVPYMAGANFLNLVKFKRFQKVLAMKKDNWHLAHKYEKLLGPPPESNWEDFLRREGVTFRSALSILYMGAKYAAGRRTSDGKILPAGPAAWSRWFLSKGIHGFVDFGTGTIHSNEPTQAVAFGAGVLEVLGRYENPVRDFFRLVHADPWDKPEPIFKKKRWLDKLIDAMDRAAKGRRLPLMKQLWAVLAKFSDASDLFRQGARPFVQRWWGTVRALVFDYMNEAIIQDDFDFFSEIVDSVGERGLYDMLEPYSQQARAATGVSLPAELERIKDNIDRFVDETSNYFVVDGPIEDLGEDKSSMLSDRYTRRVYDEIKKIAHGLSGSRSKSQLRELAAKAIYDVDM